MNRDDMPGPVLLRLTFDVESVEEARAKCVDAAVEIERLLKKHGVKGKIVVGEPIIREAP